MLKKLFLPAAVMALVFTACESDSSTSPKTDGQLQGNGTEQSGEINNNGANNATVKTDPVSADASSGAPCSVEQLSANSFVMTMKEDGVVTKITTAIAGDQAKIDYVSIYDESVSMAMIQSLCESNKQEALTKNATVTCEGRTMTIHEVSAAEIGFDGALESAENVCKEMNAYFSKNDSNQTDSGLNADPVIDNPDQTSNSEQGTSDRATCRVTENTTNTLKMIAVQPDSGSIYTSYEYKNETLVTEIRFEFLPTVSLSEINEFCAEAKADAIEMFEEEGVNADVKCDGYRITETVTETTSMNVLPFIAAEMVEYCNEIQRTGVIPEDDEDDF